MGNSNIVVYLPEIMGNRLKKKIKIIHHFICLDYDTDKSFMLISETDDENVLATYSVKMQMHKEYVQTYPYYSEILN
jgi:hypothetical protein